MHKLSSAAIIYIILLNILSFAIPSLPNLYSQENSSGTLPLNIEGEKVKYLIDKGFVIAIEKASIFYREIKIFADTIKINVNKEEVEAIDNVFYLKGENVVKANYLFYNLKEKKGYMRDILQGYFPPWYWEGERIDILSEDEFVLLHGSFTTCDQDNPHYRFSSSRATLHIGEKATMRNFVFRLREFPILYLPYYYTYLKYTPYGLVNWVGHSSEKGWMDIAHYNWYVNQNFRGRIYLDYLQNLGWGGGFDVDLKTNRGENYLYGYYMEEDEDFYEDEDVKRFGGTGEDEFKRWKGVFKHRQQWHGNVTSILKLERFSDKNFNKDFYSEERKKGWDTFPLSRDAESFFSLEKVRPNDNWILLSRYALNDFEHLIERKPSISFLSRENKVSRLPIYYKVEANYSSLEEVFPEEEGIEEDTELQRIDVFGKISSPHKVKGWFVSEPYLNLKVTGYSKNINDDEVLRYTERIGWNLRSKLVKSYGRTEHIFQPQIEYYYRPEPNIHRDELIKLDLVDRIKSQNGVFVELTNRLKIPQREKIEKTPILKEYKRFDSKESQIQKDFLEEALRPYEKAFRESFNLRIFGDYSLEENEWGNIFLENTIIPKPGVSLISDAIYAPDKRQIEIINSNLGISRWKRWNSSVGISYYRDRDLYRWRGRLWFDFSPACEIEFSATYDIPDSFLRSGGVYIKKNLHCWMAELQLSSFKRRKDEEHQFEIFLTFRIREVPGFEIPLRGEIKPGGEEYGR